LLAISTWYLAHRVPGQSRLNANGQLPSAESENRELRTQK
jgi:hypothetical protein